MNAIRIIIPLGLGLVAGVINYFAVRGMTTPLELVGVKQDLREGAEVKADQLVKVQVRADDPTILRSVVPWAERGTVIDRRVNRPLAAGEVVLFADVRSETTNDLQGLLRPGEMTFTVSAAAARVAPGLKTGDSVALLIVGPAGEGDEPESGPNRLLGPFRLLWVGDRADPFKVGGGSDVRRVTVAVPVSAGNVLGPLSRELEAAVRPGTSAGGDRRPRVLAVEYFKAGG